MPYTRQQWASDVLKALGNQNPEPGLTNWLVGWTDYETAPGQTAAYNLLNTTLPEPGATNYNSVGVKNYTSYAQGVQATAATLRGGYYPTLLADLQSNNLSDLISNQAVTQQIGTWGTHKSGAQIQAIAGQGAQDTYGGTVTTVSTQPTSQGTIPTTSPTSSSTTSNTASSDPWYCFFMPIPGVPGCTQTSSLDWADIGIRAGLILLGGLVILVVIGKMLQKPAVEVVE